MDLLFYIAIPFISGLVGWGTNIIAIKMMFYPLEFIGKPPFLGWQGIIPSKIARMASITVDLMTTKLISVEEVFSRMEPDRVAEELDDSLEIIIEPIVRKIMNHYSPLLWNSIPERVKNIIFQSVRKDRPKVVAQIMEEVKNNITNLFDLKKMIIDALMRDKKLMNEIFLNCGREEFKFIEISGLFLGFAFGLIQMAVWAYYKAWWILPVAGLLVGYITNWLALKMIFFPTTPKDFGPFSLHGVFLMRQNEVAIEYGKLIALEILNPNNIIKAIVSGPMTDNFFRIVEKHTMDAIDEHAGLSKPVMEVLMGEEKFMEMKSEICDNLMKDLPETLKSMADYAEKSMDIQNTLTDKLSSLSANDYIGILRPAFKQDEWKLILAGAVLGLIVGFFQLVTMFGDVI